MKKVSFFYFRADLISSNFMNLRNEKIRFRRNNDLLKGGGPSISAAVIVFCSCKNADSASIIFFLRGGPSVLAAIMPFFDEFSDLHEQKVSK